MGLFLCANVIFAAPIDDSSPPLRVGERVQTAKRAAVFLTPPFSGRFAGNQPAGTQGSITEGPVRAGDVWWWNVQFDNGLSGWTAERELRDPAWRPACADVK